MRISKAGLFFGRLCMHKLFFVSFFIYIFLFTVPYCRRAAAVPMYVIVSSAVRYFPS